MKPLALDGHRLAAVDLETSGLQAGFHDPIQLGVAELADNCTPTGRVFNMLIRPVGPHWDQGAASVHGITRNELATAAEPAEVVARFCAWWRGLGLPAGKALVPVAHNWAFDSSFLVALFGVELLDEMWLRRRPRDAMQMAINANDVATLRGHVIPYPDVSLSGLSAQLGVINPRPHDALADALAEAAVVRAILARAARPARRRVAYVDRSRRAHGFSSSLVG